MPPPVRQSQNTEEKRQKLNLDYMVTIKSEYYIFDQSEQRWRVRVDYPMGLTDDDVEDILMQQTNSYFRFDGKVPGFIPTIKIQERTKTPI